MSYVGATMPSCDNALSVFPNPASDNIIIELGSATNDVNASKASSATASAAIQEIVIYDKLGIVRFRKKFSPGSSTQTISLSGLSSDVYTLQVFDGANWQSKKIIIKH